MKRTEKVNRARMRQRKTRTKKRAEKGKSCGREHKLKKKDHFCKQSLISINFDIELSNSVKYIRIQA